MRADLHELPEPLVEQDADGVLKADLEAQVAIPVVAFEPRRLKGSPVTVEKNGTCGARGTTPEAAFSTSSRISSTCAEWDA
ncbi:hypothetical protein SVIO_025750 [Streptomyces violaceusniger]|uniref:Uncharacterized protein n=1 Tax=Streptomyces violaceusniger TaxID=68280 RepID=A0A4D4KTE2_STRVO|nr:hypothetical protein SVIO_025750 [Streptomyces violaceusniger]